MTFTDTRSHPNWWEILQWLQCYAALSTTIIIKAPNEGICFRGMLFIPPVEHKDREQWSCSEGLWMINTFKPNHSALRWAILQKVIYYVISFCKNVLSWRMKSHECPDPLTFYLFIFFIIIRFKCNLSNTLFNFHQLHLLCIWYLSANASMLPCYHAKLELGTSTCLA